MAVGANAAVEVTYRGESVANGAVITFDRDVFKPLGWMPGYEIAEEIVVIGATPIVMEAVSSTNLLTFCTTENCFSLNDFDGDGIYTASATINKNPESIAIDAMYAGSDEIPDVDETISFTITDKDGAGLSFSIHLDSNAAGIHGIQADGNQATETFTLSGVRVSDEGLAPGIYIIRQGSHTEKILVK